MLGIGIGEIMVVALVALIFVGPERLPKVMRELGRQYGRLRRAADELRRAFVLEADRQDAADRYARLQERRKAAAEIRKRAEEEAGEGTVAQDEGLPGLESVEEAEVVEPDADAHEVEVLPVEPPTLAAAPPVPDGVEPAAETPDGDVAVAEEA